MITTMTTMIQVEIGTNINRNHQRVDLTEIKGMDQNRPHESMILNQAMIALFALSNLSTPF